MADLKSEYECSLMLSNDVIGGKWKLRVLFHIIMGNNRFSSLQKNISDISQKVLSAQLRELEDHGIVSRRIYPDVPPRIEYSLTEEGEILKPIIEMLCRWSTDYPIKRDIKVPLEHLPE